MQAKRISRGVPDKTMIATKQPHKKNGRPRAGEGVTEKSLKVEAVKNDGQAPAVARALGINQSAAYRHLQKPDIKNAVLDARERALKKAGITLEKTYGKIGKNLRKPSGPDMRHAVDKSLMLLGEEIGVPPSGVQVIMPVVVIDGNPLNYNFFGGNGKKSASGCPTIDVPPSGDAT